MKHPIVTGLQYGDEGKGKITDVLAKQAEWVIRFNGGNNAGHTLWLNGKKVVTHSVPSGVLYSHTKNFIGAGCVIDPIALAKELNELKEAGSALNGDRLKIDYRAHITLPIHVALDSGRESSGKGIGTTKRGIGPTYATKVDRVGLRVGDLFEKDVQEKVKRICENYNLILREHGLEQSTVEKNIEALKIAQEVLSPFITKDVAPFYELSKKTKCLLEGAQGIALDIDHGSFPFVTSSNTLPAYSAVGTPFPFTRLGAVVGVMKAYLTRVGDGPMPTELNDETGARIRKNGHEFGATTGRPRRTGWLNADEVRDAVQLSDCKYIVMTKADVLLNEPVVKVLMNGKLREFKAWAQMKTVDGKLDPNLDYFTSEIEKFVGAQIVALGTGAERDAIYFRNSNAEFWNVS